MSSSTPLFSLSNNSMKNIFILSTISLIKTFNTVIVNNNSNTILTSCLVSASISENKTTASGVKRTRGRKNKTNTSGKN